MGAKPPIQTDDEVIELVAPNRRGEVRQLDGESAFAPGNPDVKINRHASVTVDQYQHYKRTSVTPRGVLLVIWPDGPQLIARSEVEVASRYFTQGEIVARSLNTMTGVVLNTLPTCHLLGLSTIIQPGGGNLLCSQPREEYASSLHSRSDTPSIKDVPGSRLKGERQYHLLQVVVYKGWMGTITDLKEAVSLRLSNNSVVEIQDLEITRGEDQFPFKVFTVGDYVETTKGVLRTGRWIYGAYSPNIAAKAAVVQVRTTAIMVNWVRMGVPGSMSSPPSVLERAELDSAEFVAYYATKLPPSCTNPDELSTVSYPNDEIHADATVRFVNQDSALAKYGNGTNGILKHERADHLGYDLNVFTVVEADLKVNVRWQDGTMTQLDSTELILHNSLDDTQFGWPGEIAYSVEVEDLPGEEGIVVPKKVGVLQSIDADQRTARIRWCPDAHIQLITIHADGESEATREVFRYAIGLAAEEIEDISLYDIEVPGSLNVCRGDTVTIQHPENCGLREIKGINWLGTIVEERLDGALTIRLGAAEPVQDVVLLREQVSVALEYDNRNARSQDVDDLENDSNDDDSMDVDDDDESDDYYLYNDNREPFYEDENGNLMDMEDVENEDWESIDENDEDLNEQPKEPTLARQDVHKLEQHANLDTEQTNLHMAEPHDDHEGDQHDTQAALDVDSHTTGNRSKSVAEANSEVQTAGPETQQAPPSYLLHDVAVPDDHHFSTCPASTFSPRMRQIQKEHRIFQKQGAIPDGVYVRSWESRADLWRVLFVGPQGTPYADAPFIVDFYLPTDYPQSPPQAFFHSWNGESNLASVGKVNPNLYEDGKICLSLLGTWEGDRNENWNPKYSTLLQVVVSLLGLVLVREPYFNEAGYEDQVGTEEARRPSILYTERVVLRSLNFAISATAALQTGRLLAGMQALEDVLHWLYLNVVHGAGLLAKLHHRVQTVLVVSAAASVAFDGLNSMSQGACISLRPVLARLEQLRSKH